MFVQSSVTPPWYLLFLFLVAVFIGVFCARYNRACFCYTKQLSAPICTCSFGFFFCYCLQFFGFNFCNICIAALCAPKLRTTLPLCPLWPLGHPLQLPAVFFPLTASQNTPCLPIPGSLWLVFSTPLVSLRPITTIFVHNCRFIPILDYLSEPPQNIMSGEISPAIAPKSCPYRPINVPLSLVFVFPGHHMT